MVSLINLSSITLTKVLILFSNSNKDRDFSYNDISSCPQKEGKHEHDTREFTGFVPQQQKSFLL